MRLYPIYNFILAELDRTEFDERDLGKLRKNDAEGELWLRLFIRSRQGDLEKAYKTLVFIFLNLFITLCLNRLGNRRSYTAIYL